MFKDPDNHNGVTIHLEPDILECEVKWALGSITTNKVSGGDGIPAELSGKPIYCKAIIIFYNSLKLGGSIFIVFFFI